jgi:hypothetical protein
MLTPDWPPGQPYPQRARHDPQCAHDVYYQEYAEWYKLISYR